MDWQQLPCVKGGSGYMYKVSAIHMSTRIKYSEILDNHKTETLAGFLLRLMDRLPPFYIVFTDNHMSFTMKYTYHKERQTQFTKTALSNDIIHALIAKGKPWRNGLIERSNRTDKENLFATIKFKCEEDRRYQLRLWEMYYNRQRPHQGIDMMTPWQKYQQANYLQTKNMTIS